MTETTDEAVEGWTEWAKSRPFDVWSGADGSRVKVQYRWRIPARMILGMTLRPEWTDALSCVGMGYSDPEWWPGCSDWDGYKRTVPPGLEWRKAEPSETDIHWGGLDLLPSPFTGQAPKVTYSGRWIGAPPFHAESLSLESWLVRSHGWRDAAKMQAAWNQRPLPSPPTIIEEPGHEGA